MTGPEHYREAERLLVRADHFIYGDGADPVAGAATAAQAQVHATLALAAATAEPHSQAYLGTDAPNPRAWSEAIS